MSIFLNLKNIYRQITIRASHGSLYVLRGFLLAVVWQIYKRTIGLPVKIRTYKGTYFLLRPNCVTSSRFIYEGRPDELYVNILAKFADEETMFIDVGGNVGLYTVLLCRDFSHGWLFEPNPVAARMAIDNISLNNANGRFHVIESAIGAEDGTALFPILDKPLATARVGDKKNDGMNKVKIIRLDHFLPKNKYFVVKVDTEGFDAHVIEGLQNYLSIGKVKVLLFESLTGEICYKIKALLNRYNYNYLMMDGKIQVQPGKGSNNNYSQNLFIVRKDLIDFYLYD